MASRGSQTVPADAHPHAPRWPKRLTRPPASHACECCMPPLRLGRGVDTQSGLRLLILVAAQVYCSWRCRGCVCLRFQLLASARDRDSPTQALRNPLDPG